MLDAVLQHTPPTMLAGHYHDTIGTALANVELSLERGLRVFDAASVSSHLPASLNVATTPMHSYMHAVVPYASLSLECCRVGGLGGCPFAPGAAGNVATE
eukprot:SAG11_NODE_3865_length_2182_cov_1.506961_1_plen_99_part_10